MGSYRSKLNAAGIIVPFSFQKSVFVSLGNVLGNNCCQRVRYDPTITRMSDKHRPAAQRGIIELLNRRVERIHIGVSDNPWPNRL